MKRHMWTAISIVAVILIAAGVIAYITARGPTGYNTRRPAPVSNAVTSPSPQVSNTGDDEWAVTGEKEGAPSAPLVEIPIEKQQLIGVKTASAEVKDIVQVTRTVGRVSYDETGLAAVNTKVEGWIEKLYVDYTGEYVKKGQPLAELYSPELYATEIEYLNALKWARSKNEGQAAGEISGMLSRDAGAVLEAARQRLKLFDIPDEEIKKIETRGKPMRTLTIYSPVSGYVVEKFAVQGVKVMPGDKLFNMADLSTVWVLADIYENELATVNVGQRAIISLSNLPGKEFYSRVDYVYPVLSGETRTGKVRFTIPNPGLKLKPQMFTDVEIKTPLGRKLTVPESAVINTGTRQLVYVDKGNGYFEPREIVSGTKSGGDVEVLKGLSPGERVATSAAFLIDSEARLKGVVQ